MSRPSGTASLILAVLTAIGVAIFLNQVALIFLLERMHRYREDDSTGWPVDGTRGWVIGLSALSTLLALVPAAVITAFYVACARCLLVLADN